MLNIRDKGRLLRIITYCERMEEITKNATIDEFNKNIGIREMICFNIF